MTAGEKIKAHLKEHGITQAQFSMMSQIPSSNLSLIVKNEREPTLTMVVRAAKVMQCTVDDLINPEMDYPLPKAQDRPKPLTQAEKEVLELAHRASQFDPKPAQLVTARQRLLGLPIGPAQPLPPLAPEPPTEDGGHVRRGRR